MCAERPDAQPIGGPFVQRVGARKHRQQVDHVLLGLLVDVQVLMLACGVKRVTKEFTQGADGYQSPIGHCLHARRPFVTGTILSAMRTICEEAKWNCYPKMPIYPVFFVSAIGRGGCQRRCAPLRC